MTKNEEIAERAAGKFSETHPNQMTWTALQKLPRAFLSAIEEARKEDAVEIRALRDLLREALGRIGNTAWPSLAARIAEALEKKEPASDTVNSPTEDEPERFFGQHIKEVVEAFKPFFRRKETDVNADDAHPTEVGITAPIPWPMLAAIAIYERLIQNPGPSLNEISKLIEEASGKAEKREKDAQIIALEASERQMADVLRDLAEFWVKHPWVGRDWTGAHSSDEPINNILSRARTLSFYYRKGERGTVCDMELPRLQTRFDEIGRAFDRYDSEEHGGGEMRLIETIRTIISVPERKQ